MKKQSISKYTEELNELVYSGYPSYDEVPFSAQLKVSTLFVHCKEDHRGQFDWLIEGERAGDNALHLARLLLIYDGCPDAANEEFEALAVSMVNYYKDVIRRDFDEAKKLYLGDKYDQQDEAGDYKNKQEDRIIIDSSRQMH